MRRKSIYIRGGESSKTTPLTNGPEIKGVFIFIKKREKKFTEYWDVNPRMKSTMLG